MPLLFPGNSRDGYIGKKLSSENRNVTQIYELSVTDRLEIFVSSDLTE